MRPVLVTPAPETVLPSDCAPTTVTPANPVPGFEESGGPSSLAPAAPSGGTAAPGSDEPVLKNSPPASDALPTSKSSPSSYNAPALQGPSAANPNRRVATRAALRARLSPLVNDPNDLFQPPRADRPWRYIVLHHSANSAGSYASIDREHRQLQGFNGCGYHFVIGNGSESPDGQIEVAQRWSEQKAGAHCRDGKIPDINDYGIGICLIGDVDQAPPTAKQIESARLLVAYLRERYAIAPDRVGTHALMAGTPTNCPGKNFPTSAILGSRGMAMR
jgi:hypothetical protein